MLEDTGFVNVEIGPGVDTFGGAGGEPNARRFEVFGYPFLAHKPGWYAAYSTAPSRSSISAPLAA